MKCRWFIFALACCASCSPPLLAQDSSLPPSSTLPAVPSASSSGPASSWTTLDSLLNELELSASTLSADSERLLLRLRESETRANELSSSLELSGQSLQACERSLKEALRQAKAREVELWIWRGAAIIAGGLAVFFGVR